MTGIVPNLTSQLSSCVPTLIRCRVHHTVTGLKAPEGQLFQKIEMIAVKEFCASLHSLVPSQPASTRP